MESKTKANNKTKVMIKASSVPGFNYDYYFIGLHRILITHDMRVYYRLLGYIKNIELTEEI